MLLESGLIRVAKKSLKKVMTDQKKSVKDEKPHGFDSCTRPCESMYAMVAELH